MRWGTEEQKGKLGSQVNMLRLGKKFEDLGFSLTEQLTYFKLEKSDLHFSWNYPHLDKFDGAYLRYFYKRDPDRATSVLSGVSEGPRDLNSWESLWEQTMRKSIRWQNLRVSLHTHKHHYSNTFSPSHFCVTKQRIAQFLWYNQSPGPWLMG